MSILMSIKIRNWKRNGLVIGKNVEIEKGCSLDPSFPWLITVGDNVTMAPEVRILAHDASMKYANGKTKLGRVTIGDNVFIGTKTVVLPGVTIGSNVVIGAKSLITKDVPDNCVVCGVPAKIVRTFDNFRVKNEVYFNECIQIDSVRIRKDLEYRRMILDDLSQNKEGYLVIN